MQEGRFCNPESFHGASAQNSGCNLRVPRRRRWTCSSRSSSCAGCDQTAPSSPRGDARGSTKRGPEEGGSQKGARCQESRCPAVCRRRVWQAWPREAVGERGRRVPRPGPSLLRGSAGLGLVPRCSGFWDRVLSWRSRLSLIQLQHRRVLHTK